MTPSLHVFISGFGSPHLQEKLAILRNNMANINRYHWSRVHYTICCYDNTDLSDYEGFGNVTIIRDRLIVGQYIEKYLVPNTPSTEFDYLLCILDDIELQENVDWEKIIHYTNYFDIDILTPSITLESKFQFRYMLHEPQYKQSVIKITAALEYFCYFMRPSSYKKYHPHLNGVRNPWMWGLDMVLNKHIGLRLAVINHMNMKHWFKDESYVARPDVNPCDGYNYVLEKYQETTDSLASQPSVFYMIFDIASPVIVNTK